MRGFVYQIESNVNCYLLKYSCRKKRLSLMRQVSPQLPTLNCLISRTLVAGECALLRLLEVRQHCPG